MEGEIRLRLVVYVLLLVSGLQHFGNGEPQVPCYFIFGDSLVDDGNNNDIDTRAKCNYPPYGIDFPSGPNATGRFTNSLTAADIIGELMGFTKFIPSFASTTQNSNVDILRGVNYGSGGCGILDETGKLNQGNCISLNNQLANHQIIIGRIKPMLADATYLNKCLYLVNIGSNDYINNYFLPQYYQTSNIYTPEQYAYVLIDQYSQQLMTLYNYGARKVAVFGLGLIGCTPNATATYATNGSSCVDKINNAALLLNDLLLPLVNQANTDLPDAKFTYINSTGISLTTNLPGNIDTTQPCCNTTTRTNGLCDPNRIPCSDRSAYAFWDSFHPTAIINNETACRAYFAPNPSDAYPTGINKLVMH